MIIDNTGLVLVSTLLLFSLVIPITAILAQEEPAKNETQIVIGNTGEIKDYVWYGDYRPPDKIYTDYYNPINAFDNVVTLDSSFIQNGKSGFTVNLNDEIKDNICRAEVYLENPNSYPFNVTFGDVTFKGTMNKDIISFATVKESDGKCIDDVDKISMNFAAADEKWTAVKELKLYSDKEVDPPPVECDPGWHLENGVCVKDGEPPDPINNGTSTFNISNSNATLNFQNSTVILKLDNIIVDIGNETEITDSYSNISKPVSQVTIKGADE